ncbi:NUDIX hydrolase [Alphaproteobacteria bacterium]|nr:NUDIX hydrolase [Alphaproteobacteria bacterium]
MKQKKYIARSMEKKELKFTPKREKDTKIPRPRDASSLVLLNNSGKSVKVLLGKRSDKTRFMPGAWVFPGGVVDKTDHTISINTSLNKNIIKRLAVSNNERTAKALAVASIRETVEETGLILGKKCGNTTKVDYGEDNNGISIMSKLGLEPDLSKLFYLGRAITPTFSPIRFHARFFVADAKHLTGKIQTTNELVEIEWVSLEKATKLPMADVTEFMINELLTFGGDILKIKKMLDNRPMFTWKMGKQWITRK